MFALFGSHSSTHKCVQGGSKIERTRDLFEQALEKCPAKSCKPIFMMYANFEEEHGLAKRAMSVYDRATSSVADEDKFEVRYSVLVSNKDTSKPPTALHHIHCQSHI